MKQTWIVALALVGAIIGAVPSATLSAKDGWTTLFDGKHGLKGWEIVGDADWEVIDGVAQATKGTGYSFLVTPMVYTDFEVQAEIWATPDANSGVFLRCTDPKTITSRNAYEMNIFDQRPDPAYRTGGIINVAKPLRTVNAGNKWTKMDITAKGPKLTVVFDGMKVSEGEDAMHTSGRIALQWAAGTVKFRNVRVRTL